MTRLCLSSELVFQHTWCPSCSSSTSVGGWSENLVHPSILLNTLCRIHLFGAGYGVFDVSLWPISVDSAVIDVELEVDDSSSKLLI